MIRKLITISLTWTCLVAQYPVEARQHKQESFRTNDMQVHIEEIASPEIQLLFPEMKQAVIFRGKEPLQRNVNYNLILELFYSVDRRGQKVWINPAETDSLIIGDNSYYYFEDEGYFLAIKESPGRSLLVKHVVDISTQAVAIGAYGTADPTASVDVLRSLPGSSEGDYANRTFLLQNPAGQQLQITLRREDHYYFLKNDSPVDISNRRALQRSFSDHRSDLRTFLRRHNIDFDNREDMMSLAEFLVLLGE